jgi:putative membrane protein
MFVAKILAIVALIMGNGAAFAGSPILKDSWAVDISNAVRDADTSAADTALGKSTNNSVKLFAEQIKRDYSAEKEHSDQLGLSAENNELSQSLTDVGNERSKELSGLNGPAFDKAYLQNEVAYNVFAIGVIEVTLLPSIKNAGLKRVMESRLALMKSHKKDAEALLEKLK